MPRNFPTRFKGLTQADAFAPLARSGRSCPSVELQHSLPSNTESVSSAVNLVLRFISKFRKVDGSEAGIEMALHEALTNAVVHGNHQDPNKHVYVACRCSKNGEVSITVRDQGEGFDWDAISETITQEPPLSTHRRGIHLMRALMDEVCFDDGGVVVRMRMDGNVGPATSRRSQ